MSRPEQQEWEKRLQWLFSNPKTPEPIAKDICSALTELNDLRAKIAKIEAPTRELEGTYPLVLYLPSKADADALVDALTKIRPSLKARKFE